MIDGDNITMRYLNTDKYICLKRDVVRKYFIYAYCYIAHSKQGCSVDNDIVIYDWNFKFADRNWFWTALSRAKDFNRVKFFRYDDDEDLVKDLVGNYLINKVKNYKQQDMKAKREIDSNEYIDEEWLMSLINTNCECCGCVLYIDYDGKNVVSNLSAQRVDCDIGHFKSNCKGLCYECNRGLSNKISI